MAQPEEIELKLEVPPDRVDSLYRLPHLKGVKPNKSKTLLSVNFDTDKQKLRKNGLSLRVRQELHRRGKKVRMQGRQLAELDARHRRKLGIRAKKLRYAAEFSAGIFPSKKSSRRRDKFVGKLKAMQDTLDEHNDIRAQLASDQP
jgi:inorganic triphosphatase YgiF